MRVLTCLLILFFECTTLIAGARILMMAPVCSKSHRHGFMPIMEALAQRGHQVTVITPYSSQKNVTNLREIKIKSAFEDMDIDWFSKASEGPIKAFTGIVNMFSTISESGYQSLMANDEFQKIFKSREVDIVVVDAILNDFTLPIIEALNVPWIYYCPAAGVPWLYHAMGIPQEYSYVPSGAGDFGSNMTFIQRLTNMLGGEAFVHLRKSLVLGFVDKLVAKDFPNATPTAEFERQAELAIVNSHPATAWLRPLPPNVIPIPALHVRPAQKLPEELQKLADEAEDGFIVFTLGSVIPVSSMSPEVLQVFIKVFARLPQRVFWKWEKPEQIKDKVSPNVVLLDWLPQQDLLGHENARMFISHGGLMGIQEASYHGVPLLGLPFGNDQLGNMVKATQEGYALKLSWTNLNEEILYDTIQKLLNEPSYLNNALRMSRLMHDNLLAGTDVASYWVEYVIRHGGAKHLQLASKDMPLYKAYLLDVWLFLGAVAFVLIYIDVLIVKWLVKKCRPQKEKVQ